MFPCRLRERVTVSESPESHDEAIEEATSAAAEEVSGETSTELDAPAADESAELVRIYADAAWQGRGVGPALLEQRVRSAGDAGMKTPDDSLIIQLTWRGTYLALLKWDFSSEVQQGQ